MPCGDMHQTTTDALVLHFFRGQPVSDEISGTSFVAQIFTNASDIRNADGRAKSGDDPPTPGINLVGFRPVLPEFNAAQLCTAGIDGHFVR